MPIPFVFFTHQNPVDWDVNPSVDAPFALKPPNGTDDVLLHRDLVRILIECAFQIKAGSTADPHLLSNADDLASRLRGIQPAFFDAAGDRLGGHGEFVVVLRPQIVGAGAPVMGDDLLEVWTRTAPTPPRLGSESRPW